MDINLHPKQFYALTTPATEVFFGGAVGGGKSHLLRVAAIVYSIWVPGLQTYIFRRTHKDLIRNHIHTPGGFPNLLKDMLDRKLVTWNKTDNSFDFKNGSRIQLAHCQYESDVYDYNGAQIGFLAIDEATHLSEYVYRFLRSRVRLGTLDVPSQPVKTVDHGEVDVKQLFPRILACSNPGNISHNFYKREFVAHGEHIWRAPPSEGGMMRQFVRSSIDDNPTLLKNDPGYKDRVRGLGSDYLTEAMLNGDWDIVCGGAIDDIWNSRRHIIDNFRVPRGWTIDRSYDYGSSAPYGVLWYAESNGEEVEMPDGTFKSFPPGTLFVINELYGANDKDEGLAETPSETALKIKQSELEIGIQGRVVPGPADHAIFDTDRGDSIAKLMQREGVRWLKGNKKPGSRVNGLNLIRQRLNNVIENPIEKPGLYFFRRCVNCIRTLPVLPRDEKKPEDVDTNANDHLYDALRYKILQSNTKPKLLKVSGY